ncbi:hypothetical protein [Streptomyces sp. NPDC051993]|uniref:hypothetical protein n=1 Tax=Streptomyces sp. NPDC051993 TaxID=3155286 RepID=UPI00341AAD5D
MFSPTADYATIGADTGFTIQLSNIPISRKVGTSPIDVTERSGTSTNPNTFQNRTTQFSVGKFPSNFYLRNLICNPLVIDHGGQVTLTWERSANATYTLLYGNTSLNVTNETRRTITDIRSDTTFYLIGSVGTGTEEVKRILSTGVTVIKPDLEIGNLTVHGTVTAKDDISIAPGKKLVTPEISAAGSSIEISSSVDHTSGTVKLLGTGALEVNGRVKAKGGIEGNAEARTPLEVHQTAGLNVHANLQVGTSGGNYTAVFKKPVTVENTLSVSAGHALEANKITTVSGGTITIDKHIDMTKGTVFRTGALRGVDDGDNKTITVNAPIDFTATVDIVKAAKRGKLHKNATHRFTADTSGLLLIHAWAGNSGSTAKSEASVNTYPYRFATIADHSNGKSGAELLTVPLKRNDQAEFKITQERGTLDNHCGWWIWLPFGATNVGNGALAAAEPHEAALTTGPTAETPEEATEATAES